MTDIELPAGDFGGFIFDCDGTLADSMPLYHRAWQRALAAQGASFEFTWDLFNTTNSNQPRTWRSTSVNSSNYLQPDGVTPLRPATIIAPRIYQWGATFKF